MKGKYIFGSILLLLISCDQLFSMVFDKDAEVRAFRAWANWNKPGANVVKAGQYEGIDILNFIADRGLAGHIPPSLNSLIKGRNPKQYLASIALSMLQGYGFDEGIVDVPVNPSEMAKYQEAVATIGQHIHKPQGLLAVAEISKKTTIGPHIDEHVRIANKLLTREPLTAPLVSPLYTLEGFIRSEATIRNKTFWNGDAVAHCSDVKCYTSDKGATGTAGTFSPLQRVSTTGTTEQGQKYNLRHQSALLAEKGLDPTKFTLTEIHYNVYISDAVREGREQPKGVIVKIYGAGIKEEVKPRPEVSLEYFMAHQGYIVYTLNVRGTKGFDEKLLAAQGKSEGVISTLRDATYFARMMHKVADTKGGEPDGKKFPKFSKLIKGKNIPIVLTGASFGGYMSMLVATHDETFDAVDFEAVDSDELDFSEPKLFSYAHRTTYDAYIPMMGISDVCGDMNSGTQASKTRQRSGTFQVQGSGIGDWMENAFHGLNILKDGPDNRKVSPIYRMNLLEKPMLLMHGLSDRNTSPFESIDFINTAFQDRKGDLVAAYFDRYLDHSYPGSGHRMQQFYETIFRFMDSVTWHKKNGIPFKFSPKIQNSTFAAKEAAAFLTKAFHTDLVEDDEKFILDALVLYREQKATQPSVSGLEESVWETAKSRNRLSYIKALFARKARAVYPYPIRTLQSRQVRDDAKERIFKEIGLNGYTLGSPPPSNFLDPNFRDANNNPTGQILQYYVSDDYWLLSPRFDASKNVIGLASNAAEYIPYYDELMKREFLDIIRNKPYILDAFVESILETNIFFNEKDLPTLEQMIASSVTQVPPPPAQIARQQVIPLRPIVLGANGSGNIELSYGTLASQLKSLPVDATGKAGRYTIGERTIEPTMLVIKKITEGDCNLSDQELQPFLICVATALNVAVAPNKELVEAVAGAYFSLKENANIAYVVRDPKNVSYVSTGRGHVSIREEDLLISFRKYCDYLRTGQNPAPGAVNPRLLNDIEALKQK